MPKPTFTPLSSPTGTSIESSLSDFGQQAHLAAFADQQGLADFVFQLADHLAHRGLGDVEPFGCDGEAVLADGFDEVAEGAQVHKFMKKTTRWN